MSKTQTPAATLPPDVAAYLEAATLSVMAEQGFVPSSAVAVAFFLGRNSKAIGERAMKSMLSMLRNQKRPAALLAVATAIYDAAAAEASR